LVVGWRRCPQQLTTFSGYQMAQGNYANFFWLGYILDCWSCGILRAFGGLTSEFWAVFEKLFCMLLIQKQKLWQ